MAKEVTRELGRTVQVGGSEVQKPWSQRSMVWEEPAWKGTRVAGKATPVSDGRRGGLRASQDLTLSVMRSHWKDLSWSELSYLPLQGPPRWEELDQGASGVAGNGRPEEPFMVGSNGTPEPNAFKDGVRCNI